MSTTPGVFGGEWTVECLSSGLWSKTFFIEGSDASDGAYALGWDGMGTGLATRTVLTTPPMTVSGARWCVRFEWATAAYGPDTSLRRTAAAYTLASGLVVDLVSDNSSVVGTGPGLGPVLYDSASLRLTCRDPAVDPWHPFTNAYDFVLPGRRVDRPLQPIR